jgi:hypothetical protein
MPVDGKKPLKNKGKARFARSFCKGALPNVGADFTPYRRRNHSPAPGTIHATHTNVRQGDFAASSGYRSDRRLRSFGYGFAALVARADSPGQTSAET